MGVNAEAVQHDLNAGAAAVPWWRGPMLSLDFETTDKEPLLARPVQCSLVLVVDGQLKGRRTWLVDAGVEIPPETTKIHGITTADVKAKGVPPEKFLPELLDMLRARWTRTVPLCGMNIVYDLTVLAAELRRAGGKMLELLGPVLDAMVLDRFADNYQGRRRGSRKLVDLCFHYQVPIEQAHHAGHDALAAAQVIHKIAESFPSIAEISLEEMQPLQARVFRERAEGLNKHWIASGSSSRITNFDWPVQALPPASEVAGG